MAARGRYQPTSTRSPCPLCNNTSGHCKSKVGDRGDTLTYCHNNVSNPGRSINDLWFLKQTKDGQGDWGVWTATPPKSEAPEVTADDRDTAFRKFIGSRSLDAIDRAELNGRGISDEEIDRWDVVSFGGKQPGYLVPCYDPQGRIVGAQWRLRGAVEGSRYKWISWIEGGSQFDGELPLTVQRPIGVAPAGIAVVEGIGAKSFILAQRTGMVAIGAGSDSQFISSPKHWRRYLAALSAEIKSTTIDFYPDAGSIRNASVLGKYRQWFEFVQELGYTVRIAWWGQITKGEAPDADELTADVEVRFITIAEFEAIAAEHGAAPTQAKFLDEVDRLIAQGKTRAEAIVEMGEMAQKFNFKGDVAGLLRLRSEDAEQSEAVEGLRERLEKELKNRSFDVPVERLFPGPEGAKFCQWVRWQAAQIGTNPLALVFTWLSGVASASASANRIWLGGDHYAKPIFWSAIVGGVGRGKTPAQMAALSPLFAIHAEAQERHNQAWDDYDRNMKSYRKAGKAPDGDPGDEPTEPKTPRNYIVSDITQEALAETQVNQPDAGLLVYRDELAGLFAGMGQYKGGKSDDRQKLLELYGGAAIDVTRKGKRKLFAKSSSISFTGSIQPDVISKLMGDCDDTDGLWSRFNFLIADVQGLRPAEPSKNAPPNYIDWLKGIYRRVSEFAAKSYSIADDGFALFKQYNSALLDRIEQAPRQVFAGLYSKARNKIGSVALILHLMNAAIERTTPEGEVDHDTTAAAIDLVNMSLNQAHQLIDRGEEQTGGTEALCGAVWRYVDRRIDRASDWQSIARGVGALRPKPGDKKGDRLNSKTSVLRLLRLLEESGCGRILEDGRFAAGDLSPAAKAEVVESIAIEVPIPEFAIEYEEVFEYQEEPAFEPGDAVLITQGDHVGKKGTIGNLSDLIARVFGPEIGESVLIPIAHLIRKNAGD